MLLLGGCGHTRLAFIFFYNQNNNAVMKTTVHTAVDTCTKIPNTLGPWRGFEPTTLCFKDEDCVGTYITPPGRPDSTFAMKYQ
jgi:hypothetical protein